MVNPQLLDYVKTNKVNGYSRVQLHQSLIESGYVETQVADALREGFDGNTASPVQSSKNDVPGGIIFVGVLFIVLGSIHTIIAGILISLVIGGVELINLANLILLLVLVLGILHIVSGVGLLKIRKWAWVMCLVLALPYVGGMVGIIILVLLGKYKDLFGIKFG